MPVYHVEEDLSYMEDAITSSAIFNSILRRFADSQIAAVRSSEAVEMEVGR